MHFIRCVQAYTKDIIIISTFSKRKQEKSKKNLENCFLLIFDLLKTLQLMKSLKKACLYSCRPKFSPQFKDSPQ